MASLTVIKGPDQGRRFELLGDAPTLGRDADNSIRLHDTEISRHHAEFRKSDGDAYSVADLQSSNGTYLNGKRVEGGPLKTGDRIRVGQSELIFTAEVSDASSVDLAGKINMLGDDQVREPSAVISAIKFSRGSEFLRNPELAGSEWLRDALSNLAVMYETSQAVSRISDVDQLLDHIMNLVFKSMKPDRGCIMLRNPESDEVEPKLVRFADPSDQSGQIVISRTITEWVLTKQEGVLVLDATQDERFASAQSVAQLGIREVICVPLRGRHETLGVLYIDQQGDRKEILKTNRPSKFTEDHLKLVIAISHQAGLALEDSRFYTAMLEAEKLAAIGQTIATLSHHIKNILQGIRAGSYVIEMGFKDTNMDLVKQGWGSVQKNQDKIYNLVMDMLSYSKDREPALERTDLNKVVTEVVELMAPRAREFGAKIESSLAENIGDVCIDQEGIHRALLNIVTNAIDAVEGRPDGQVLVKTSVDRAGKFVRISVTDNGVGIASNKLERIFKIFHSTKGAKGSGLGLPVSRKIAREHGGDISVKSKVGAGSRFIIKLPLRRPAGEANDRSAAIFETRIDMLTQYGDE